MTKTIDGIILEKVVKVAESLGFSVKYGTKHKYLLLAEGMVPCPVAASTNVKTMVVPWVKRATGYDSNELYSFFKKGKKEVERRYE